MRESDLYPNGGEQPIQVSNKASTPRDTSSIIGENGREVAVCLGGESAPALKFGGQDEAVGGYQDLPPGYHSAGLSLEEVLGEYPSRATTPQRTR